MTGSRTRRIGFKIVRPERRDDPDVGACQPGHVEEQLIGTGASAMRIVDDEHKRLTAGHIVQQAGDRRRGFPGEGLPGTIGAAGVQQEVIENAGVRQQRNGG